MEQVPDHLDLVLAGRPDQRLDRGKIKNPTASVDQRPAYAVAHCPYADLAQPAVVGVGKAQVPGLVDQVDPIAVAVESGCTFKPAEKVAVEQHGARSPSLCSRPVY